MNQTLRQRHGLHNALVHLQRRRIRKAASRTGLRPNAPARWNASAILRDALALVAVATLIGLTFGLFLRGAL